MSFAERILVFILVIVALRATTVPSFGQSSKWVTAYYAGWSQGWTNNGVLPAGEIDFTAVTHIIHFSLVPNGDGSIDTLSNSITETNSAQLIAAAHRAGKKVLISVGGWGSDISFRSATGILTLGLFVANILNFMKRRGYDGIDMDWEVLEESDSVEFVSLARLMRTIMNTMSPRPLLTAAIGWRPRLVAAAQQYFDQINIMTYDLSGAWPGWITWHNSPLLAGGYKFPDNTRPVPSVDGLVVDFAGAGIDRSKIGIGIDFYGYVWSGGGGTSTGGVTKPGQTWSIAPQVRANVPFSTIYTQYYSPERYHWDSLARAAYLSIDSLSDSGDKFISYDDENTCKSKVAYAQAEGLGGVFIWELGGGYLPAGYPQRDRLLHAVRETAVVVGPPPARAPSGFALSQNYPNPFNSTTTIEFDLPSGGYTVLKLYSTLGQEVATIWRGNLESGKHTMKFSSDKLASGTYVYELVSGSAVLTRKMMLAK